MSRHIGGEHPARSVIRRDSSASATATPPTYAAGARAPMPPAMSPSPSLSFASRSGAMSLSRLSTVSPLARRRPAPSPAPSTSPSHALMGPPPVPPYPLPSVPNSDTGAPSTVRLASPTSLAPGSRSSTPLRSVATPYRIPRDSTAATPRPESAVSGRSGRQTGLPSARPSTGLSAFGEEGEHLVAISQGRGATVQIGIALMNLETGKVRWRMPIGAPGEPAHQQLIMTQLSDTHTFAKMVHHLTLHYPRAVLVADTVVSFNGAPDKRTLVDKIADEFGLQCEAVARQHWNSHTGAFSPFSGLDMVRRFAIEDERKASTVMSVADKYFACCAVSALLWHIDSRQNVSFHDRSLHMEYKTMMGHMFIDADTVKNLELVKNSLTLKANNTLYSAAACVVMGNLDSCLTPMGSRMLRADVLQPCNQRVMLENRLEVVDELLTIPEQLKEIRNGLKSLDKADIDKLVTNFNKKPRHVGQVNVTQQRITNLLQLRNIVRIIPRIRQALFGRKSVLLNGIEMKLSHTGVQEIQTRIDERIEDNQTLGVRGARGETAMNGKIYAVKANFNRMLDIARQAYRENMAQIQEEDYDLAVDVEWSESGYRFTCDVESFPVPHPKDFRNVERGKRLVRFSTQDLIKSSARVLQSRQEVFIMSDEIVAELTDHVVEVIGCLYACSEALSLLDVLAAFAHNALVLAIKSGRHPILEKTLGHGECVPNDVYATDGPANFLLIQGPNMSGKSTYLRQIGLLTVMAMVGSFVPAEYASIRLHDSLLSRLSNDDSMEKSLSTFAAEMATSAMILGELFLLSTTECAELTTGTATADSLILIDELGRGTAPIEGIGMAHAIAEDLIKRKSFVFFATHFQELAQTLCTLPGVNILHLQVQTNPDGVAPGEFASTFQYKVREGACEEKHYGLELAKLAGLPPTVMAKATEVAHKLVALEEKGRNAQVTTAIAMRRKAVLELRGKLQQIVESSRLAAPDLVAYLRTLEQDMYDTLKRAYDLEQEATAARDGTATDADGNVVMGDSVAAYEVA